MVNKKNSLSAKKIEDLINEQNLHIFDEENWINKELRKIAEVTYSYDDETKINTTLFVMVWWLDLEEYKKSNDEKKEILLLKAKINLIKLINKKKEQIKTALWEIELIDVFSKETVETDIKRIFINSLIEKRDFLDYCLNWLDYEIEKAGFQSDLSTEEEKEVDEKLYILDTKLFWWDIKEHADEVILAYEYFIWKYNENKDKLTIEEDKKLSKYIEKVIAFLPNKYVYKVKKEPKQIAWEYLNYDIKRSSYMLWFNILIEALDKLTHIAESDESAKSISDWPKWLQFPTTKNFDSIKILRFFKLGNHEIETHNITDYNWRQIIWNLRWANSTEKDEGVSILMEQLFMYWKELYKVDKDWDLILDIEKIQINSNFTKTLMWEILSNDQLLDFLELSNKIDPDIISPLDRYYRLKRNNKYSVQHKDTTYTRWLLKTVNIINNYIKSKWQKWIKPLDLFIWKISFDETIKLKRIKEKKEKSWKKIEIIKPLFISDAVYFAITEKLNWKNWDITSDKFYNYLKDKYPIFDLKYEEVRQISYKTKRNVVWIINILLKTIWEYQINELKLTNKNTINWLLKTWINQYIPRIEQVQSKLHPSRRNAK